MTISKELEASGVLDKLILAMDAFNKVAAGSISRIEAPGGEGGTYTFKIKDFQNAYSAVNVAKEELANRLQYMLLIKSNTIEAFRQYYKEIRTMAEKLITEGKPGLAKVIIESLTKNEIQRLVEGSDLNQNLDDLFKPEYWEEKKDSKQSEVKIRYWKKFDRSLEKVPLSNTALFNYYEKLKVKTQEVKAFTWQLTAIDVFKDDLKRGNNPSLVTPNNEKLKDKSTEEISHIITGYRDVYALLKNDPRVKAVEDNDKISTLENLLKTDVRSAKIQVSVESQRIVDKTAELKQVSADAIPNIAHNTSLKSKPKDVELTFLSHHLLNYKEEGKNAVTVSEWEKQNPLDVLVLLVKLENYVANHKGASKSFMGINKAAQAQVAQKLITALKTGDSSSINQAVTEAKKQISTKGLTVFYKRTQLEVLVSEIEKARLKQGAIEKSKDASKENREFIELDLDSDVEADTDLPTAEIASKQYSERKGSTSQ